jgi:hypothetical protein
LVGTAELVLVLAVLGFEVAELPLRLELETLIGRDQLVVSLLEALLLLVELALEHLTLVLDAA